MEMSWLSLGSDYIRNLCFATKIEILLTACYSRVGQGKGTVRKPLRLICVLHVGLLLWAVGKTVFF